MDTTRAIYNLSIHEHPIFPSSRFIFAKCDACHVKDFIYGGYFCNDSYCYGWFHKECANSPHKINHPSHSDHPLLLTNDSRDDLCDFCGQKLLSPYYICTICKFKVDLICGIKPSSLAIEHPMCHDHPLVFLKKQEDHEVSCEVCKDTIGGMSYSCLECNLHFHVDCINLSKEVNHPCHSSHPLKAISSGSLPDNAEKKCFLCLDQLENMLYHCSICNFTMCFDCTKNPPPLVIEHSKTHMHPLTLFLSKISFFCKICGVHGDHNMPYICLKCDFIVEGACINLPRVISINRHDHRITFTPHLGYEHVKCGVCRKSVSQYYGAYLCSVYPSYTVHSLCATNNTIWDGKDLEEIPEINEDIAPFKVVGDNLIRHFSHEEHTLGLHKDNNIYDECIRCEACIHPVGFGPIYRCFICQFTLHEKCASLPKKKKLVFDTTVYTLETVNGAVDCKLCGILSDGFKYTSQGKSDVDVHCGSLYEPFVHDSHLHPLYFEILENHYCDACKRDTYGYILRCEACDFDLCLYCANLPKKIWHMIDDHPLTLYCGEKPSTENWCDICENDLDSDKWIFTCFDCEVTLHVQCVLGDFSRLRPEWFIVAQEKMFLVVFNNLNTRPICSQCHLRCKVSFILKYHDEDNVYICSRSCLSNFTDLKI